jgi:mannan endo-1,4-beta-mannosidase
MVKSSLFCISIILFLFNCTKEDDLFDSNAKRIPPNITTPNTFADKNLNKEAKNLYNKLINITQKGIAFGQQQPFGTGNNFPVINKLENDFFEVTGDHPAIAGFDLELIGLQLEGNFLDAFINQFTEKVIEAHKNGSIITISWHYVNPNGFSLVNNTENFYGVVTSLLKGGQFREDFINRLERAARLLNSLVDENGRPIPVLFRPWHEMNGDFFFWGEGFRTTAEYKQLWRDTVKILSENFKVHNVLYVYAPNFVANRSEYLKNYPENEFVDLLGIDVYDFKNGNFLNTAIRNLQIVEEIAAEKNMLFALTETGLTNLVNNNWFTESLYKAIKNSSITYTMIWRNDMTTFFHAPFLCHPSETNFNEFLNKEIIFLRDNLF